jgi:hypothetical protein
MGESERGHTVERVAMTFWCASGHETQTYFAVSAEVPEIWDCHWCGLPAGMDPDNPPVATPAAPFKTHLAYVRERRSDADAEILLAEALSKQRAGGQ